MPMFSLAYRSDNLIEDLTTDSLGAMTDLLDVARSRNQRLGVTGALLFNEGKFTQILEGEEPAVREVFKSIQNDPRHTDIFVFPHQVYEQRRFEKWSMAFIGPTPAARAYYKRFTGENSFEWSLASQTALLDLMLDLLSLENGMDP